MTLNNKQLLKSYIAINLIKLNKMSHSDIIIITGTLFFCSTVGVYASIYKRQILKYPLVKRAFTYFVDFILFLCYFFCFWNLVHSKCFIIILTSNFVFLKYFNDLFILILKKGGHFKRTK
jgi:hypothetical protein